MGVENRALTLFESPGEGGDKSTVFYVFEIPKKEKSNERPNDLQRDAPLLKF